MTKTPTPEATIADALLRIGGPIRATLVELLGRTGGSADREARIAKALVPVDRSIAKHLAEAAGSECRPWVDVHTGTTRKMYGSYVRGFAGSPAQG